MKNLVILSLIININIVVSAQTLKAKYEVTKIERVPIENQKVSEVFLTFEGFVYQNDTASISYLKPMYLEQYANGTVSLGTSSIGSNLKFMLDMDTIQMIYLYKKLYDKCWAYNKSSKSFNVFSISENLIKWKVLPETKTINGFECTKAVAYHQRDSNNVIATIWFDPTHDMKIGLFRTQSTPGLIVEADWTSRGIRYNLVEFEPDVIVTNDLFWPTVFNKVLFTDQSRSKVKKPDDSKKVEIMSQ